MNTDKSGAGRIVGLSTLGGTMSKRNIARVSPNTKKVFFG
jgi:hypothetical protein